MIVVAFLLLQLVDVALTVAILRGGGIELNPILPNDWRLHIVVKSAFVGAIAIDGRAVPIATTLSAVAVAWNVRQMVRQRRHRRAQEAL